MRRRVQALAIARLSSRSVVQGDVGTGPGVLCARARAYGDVNGVYKSVTVEGGGRRWTTGGAARGARQVPVGARWYPWGDGARGHVPPICGALADDGEDPGEEISRRKPTPSSNPGSSTTLRSESGSLRVPPEPTVWCLMLRHIGPGVLRISSRTGSTVTPSGCGHVVGRRYSGS